jgi:hypothetical protein
MRIMNQKIKVKQIHRLGKGSVDLLLLKMLHGSTRKPCRKHTRTFLQILKKIECTFVHKRKETLFWQLDFLERQV